MKILFDGFWWHRGPGANRTVQRELMLAWARRFPNDDISVALRNDADPAGLPSGMRVLRTRMWPHALSNRFELPRFGRMVNADVMVCHNYAPVSGASAVFLHDVMFEEHPKWFSLAERLYFSPMLQWAQRAAVIATSTHTEAARVAKHAPRLPAAAVTGLGIPPGLGGAKARPAGVPEGSEFAVTVGRLNVRKNLETVMLAASNSSRITPTSPLYIVGSTAHSGRGSQIPERAQPLIDDGRIVMLGAIPDDELAWLYANAAVTLSLSLDEGFGMPCVEAATFGSPLLVSDISVYRETVGGYAAFVDPLDEHAVAAQLDTVWGVRPDDDARQRAIGDYTWGAAAAALRAAIV